MSFAFTSARRPRRLGLAPMIDVVFLLLVFFMLVARLQPQAGIALTPQETGASGAYLGPPRVVSLGANGGVSLNGTALAHQDLPSALAGLMAAPSDPIVIETGAEANVQDLVTILGSLTRAGLSNLIVLP